MKKITLATLKSFIKKNKDNGQLHINVRGAFDGMVDGVRYDSNSSFVPATKSDGYAATLGIQGVWVVRGGRDFITAYNNNGFVGYHVSNCCGSFILAIPA